MYTREIWKLLIEKENYFFLALLLSLSLTIFISFMCGNFVPNKYGTRYIVQLVDSHKTVGLIPSTNVWHGVTHWGLHSRREKARADIKAILSNRESFRAATNVRDTVWKKKKQHRNQAIKATTMKMWLEMNLIVIAFVWDKSMPSSLKIE